MIRIDLMLQNKVGILKRLKICHFKSDFRVINNDLLLRIILYDEVEEMISDDNRNLFACSN